MTQKAQAPVYLTSTAPSHTTQQTALPQHHVKTSSQQVQARSEASYFWPVLPSVLWFTLVVVLLIAFGKKLGQLISEFMYRLRAGATVKIASVELGPIAVDNRSKISKSEKSIDERMDEDKTRENERHDLRKNTHDIMLVHRLYRSREAGQLYDIVIYVIPHRNASLAGVTRIEYFLGGYWGNKVFTAIDRSRGFPIATAAYGPLLCTAEVFFNDGTSVMLHRYLDFEMGDLAPALPAE